MVTATAVPELNWVEQARPDRALLRGEAYRIAKRVMDLVLVILALPLALPLLALCALLVLLDSSHAPVLFFQTRTGRGGRPFLMVKFRTMVVGAETMKAGLASKNELLWPDFKIADDPRVTPIGRFLRKSSLDELPQLWNVLRGDMSLVGPRPTSFAAQTYALWHTERLDVPPGITGLWQLVGRGSMEFGDRSRLDIVYIDRRCLWLDVQILIRTIPAVLGARGAR